eukprot:CAMPEP_0202726978 /NCGR_PEP_ID=MMETSP1385-20130828/184885_1 /ASSEMBLY_ACC=CAM_ASM_000861 /TAXON_ID=933848 /ORGANISM="Elphidium margaritaceum" /LENGTH=949 /DNA_ID=CAMNT_0049393209 /DNA_START=105 /DNA_END=2954 /DNA_ORIENTATION=-
MKPVFQRRKSSKNKKKNTVAATETHTSLSVDAVWICRDVVIVAESQIGTAKHNRQQTKFVQLFIEQVIKPAKPVTNNSAPSFTIYVKKRQYLFHIVYDENDLIFIALTCNTTRQKPLDATFDLLYNIKSAFLFEDGASLSDTLGDLHHSYQLKAVQPKVSVNGSRSFDHEEQIAIHRTVSNHDHQQQEQREQEHEQEEKKEAFSHHNDEHVFDDDEDEDAEEENDAYTDGAYPTSFIVYDENDLIFIALTCNTTRQKPLDATFDLLYNIKSAFLFEDGASLSDTLGDLHHSYQLKAVQPKVSVNGSRSFDHEEQIAIHRTVSNHDHQQQEQREQEHEQEEKKEAFSHHNNNNDEHVFDDDEDDDAEEENDAYTDGAYPTSFNFLNAGGDREPSKTMQTTINIPSPSHSAASDEQFGGGGGATAKHTRSKSKSKTKTRTPSNSKSKSRSLELHSTMRLELEADEDDESPSHSAASDEQFGGGGGATAKHTRSKSKTKTRTPSNSKSKSRSLELHSTMRLELEADEDDEAKMNGMPYFVLKKGWMTKLGGTFKTWRYRYFELWSNGLLNYFEDELKLKKKGCINIMDEVVSCDMYEKAAEQGKMNFFGAGKSGKPKKKSDYGITLTTHDRQWYFIISKECVRDEWFTLIQTITFERVDLNLKFEAIKQRLNRLQARWHKQFKNLEFDLDDDEHDGANIYQIQYDLNAAMKVCEKCRKDITYFKGSDLYSTYQQKLALISENIEGALSTIEGVIDSRHDAAAPRNNHNNSKKSFGKSLFSKKPAKKPSSTKSKSSKMVYKSPRFGLDENRVVLRSKIKVRLPSKKMINSKNALSKKEKLLLVVVQQTFFKINVNRDMTAPLIWRYDELTGVEDVKGVYYGTKKKSGVQRNDIQQYEFIVMHSSQRRVQLAFHDEQQAFMWHSTVKSLYDKCNQMPISPVYVKGRECNRVISL